MTPDLQTLEQADVLGLPVHLTQDYSGWLISRLHHHRGTHVVTLNAEMSIQGERNADLARVIRKADLVVPDGSGVVFYLWLRNRHIQRCPGIELAESLLKHGSQCDLPVTVFFYGGSPNVAQTAADRWQKELPKLAIAGVQHGYLSADEHHQVCEDLSSLQPSIILVGLGVPRQEFWIEEHRHLCPNSIWIGVGGSFDIWAGIKTRAPDWFRNNHLEWMYRLYKEPWRWRRMLALPKFAWRALVYSKG